ncbi:MAG: ArsR family transcriptional regulator [Thermoleophilia bacterium]|nr:ArsR family transcriptional regulator [Thermoleophilia bacterium]
MTDRCDLLCLDLPTAEGVRAAMPTAADLAAAATRAQACADPTRLSVLLALRGAAELCVCDLTWVVGKPQNLVSHHLRKLRDAGMVASRREAKVVFYSLTELAAPLLDALAPSPVAAGR